MRAPSSDFVGCLLVLGSIALACSARTESTHAGGSGGMGTGGGQAAATGVGSASSGGTPACSAGLSQCGSECVDLLQSPSHCGACALPCSVNQSCVNGQCACQSGLTLCSGTCVDLQSDGLHCGACGVACPAGELCSAGLCGTTCTVAGQTPCGQSCVDLMTDEQHCGICGAPCGAGHQCVHGECSCPAELTLCSGTCVDTATSVTDCGACGIACAANETCTDGTCEGEPAGAGGATATGGAATGGRGQGTGGQGQGTGGQGQGTGGSTSLPEGPCDIYAASNTPCVGAYSMVRVLSSDYAGPLYQVRRGAPNPDRNTGSGGQTQDIGSVNGFADAASQEAFCGNEACTVSILYDQSGTGNDLTAAPRGCYEREAAEDDYESSATRQSLSIGGHDVYGLYMNPHEGYRNNEAMGTAEGQESQGVYMVADGTHAGSACCWDFGTAARDVCWGPTGVMAALMFGIGYWGYGEGSGPWMLGDFELGVWAGGSFPSFGMETPPIYQPTDEEIYNPNNPSLRIPFAVGFLSNEMGQYSLRMGDATSGDMTTAYDGPTGIPWDLQGAIILGIGGDNSNWSNGTFYEGAVTYGRPPAQADEAVYQNIRAAGYGQ